MLSEHADKVSDDEKTAIETALAELEEALKGDDKSAIDAKVEALSQASAPVAQKMYAEQAEAGQAGATDAGATDDADDVVDAEFEEVKEDDKK